MNKLLSEMTASEVVWECSSADTPIETPIEIETVNPYESELRRVETELGAMRLMTPNERSAAAAREYVACKKVNDALISKAGALRARFEKLILEIDDLSLTPEHHYAKRPAIALLRKAILEQCDTTWAVRNEPAPRSASEWYAGEEKRLDFARQFYRTHSAEYELIKDARSDRLESLRQQLTA